MIKWFDSSMMTGLPVITNTRGDLVTMLNALLVNGVNSKPVATIAYTDGVCTLEVGADHGFILNSVVDIQNSSQAALADNDFKIKLVSSTKISFDCPNPVNNEIGVMVRYAPLGFEQHFASDGKACYKSPDPRYPAYLRVDDKTQMTAAPNYSKFAGVEICENMTDFDTATWQSPYDPLYPLQNRQFTTRSTGWFKWYYAAKRLSKVDNTVPTSGNRRYVLIGDETYFWLIVYPYVDAGIDSTFGAVYGFVLVDYGSQVKQALVATDGFGGNDTSVYNNPHISFVNAGSKKSIAPFYGALSFCMPVTIVYATSNSNSDTGVVSFLTSNIAANDGLALQSSINLVDTKVSARFLGVATIDKKSYGAFLKINSRLSKVEDIGQAYSLSFDLG